MSLLEDLRKVAATNLDGSDLPTHVEVQDLLGALVKTLDAAGVTVAKDLLPAPAAAVAVAAIEATEPTEQGVVSELLAEIERLKDKIEGTPSDSTAPADPTVPAAPPIEGAS